MNLLINETELVEMARLEASATEIEAAQMALEAYLCGETGVLLAEQPRTETLYPLRVTSLLLPRFGPVGALTRVRVDGADVTARWRPAGWWALEHLPQHAGDAGVCRGSTVELEYTQGWNVASAPRVLKQALALELIHRAAAPRGGVTSEQVGNVQVRYSESEALEGALQSPQARGLLAALRSPRALGVH